MHDRYHFEDLEAQAEADLEARIALTRWQLRKELGVQLQAEPAAMRHLQLETETPDEVGMHELASDEYAPEELVELFSDAHIFDWDSRECMKLKDLAKAC